MSGTAHTVNFLLTSEAQDGQAAGSYTLSRLRDFMQTMNIRTGGAYGSMVRVTDPEFGADPTGVADSTTAFQNALAAGVALVPGFQSDGVTRAVYTIDNLIFPSGGSLIGFGGAAYSGGGISSDNFIRPVIRGKTTSSRLINMDGVQGAALQGLILTGVNSASPNTADIVSGGGRGLTIRDCLLNFGKTGLGGSVPGSTQTFPTGTWECYLYNCSISECITGMTDFIDGECIGGRFAVCTNGVNLGSSSSSSKFVGTRFEWCGRTNGTNTPSPNGVAGYGAQTAGVLTSFIGCEFDANGEAGLYFNGAFENNVSGGWFHRNGTNIVSGTTLITNSAHILFNSAFGIVTNGINTKVFSDNSVFGPAATVHFTGTGGSNGGIVFCGSDLSGCQGSTAGATQVGPVSSNTLWRTGTVPTGTGANGYIVSKNLGTGTSAQDIDTR